MNKTDVAQGKTTRKRADRRYNRVMALFRSQHDQRRSQHNDPMLMRQVQNMAVYDSLSFGTLAVQQTQNIQTGVPAPGSGGMKIADIQVGEIYQITKGATENDESLHRFVEELCKKYGNTIPSEENQSDFPQQILITQSPHANSNQHVMGYILNKSGEKIAGVAVQSRCIEESTLVKKATVKVTMDSVIVKPALREQVRSAISQQEHFNQIFDEWGFSEVFEKGTAVSMIFYGVPGTGKTLMAQAIADELEMKLKIVNTGDIRSSEPGGAERTIKKIFQDANKGYDTKKPVVILFDECDSLLVDRSQVGVIIGAEVNALLTELERYKGIVIFTTNRLGKLDPALERRLTAKIEFPFPDQEERLLIWKRMIPAKAPIAKNVDFARFAEVPLTGGNIKNVVLNAARKAAYLKRSDIDKKCFLEAMQQEIAGMQSFEVAYEETAKMPVAREGMQRGEQGAQTVEHEDIGPGKDYKMEIQPAADIRDTQEKEEEEE